MPIGPTRMGWVKLERERVRRWYQKPKWKVPTIHGLVVIIQHASKRKRLTKHYFHFVRVLQKFKFIPFLTTFHVQWRKSHMVSTAKCETMVRNWTPELCGLPHIQLCLPRKRKKSQTQSMKTENVETHGTIRFIKCQSVDASIRCNVRGSEVSILHLNHHKNMRKCFHLYEVNL